MLMGPTTTEYVEKTSRGGWRITGTRVSLASVLEGYWSGQNAETIQQEYPTLSLELVYGAIAFYLGNRQELDEYLADNADAWRNRLDAVDADFVCVGHTHVPFHLDLGGTQIVNPGSVGQPRDGDPRCAYAVIENGRVEFRRVEYDIDATLRQMQEAGVSAQVLEWAESILRNGGGTSESPPDYSEWETDDRG